MSKKILAVILVVLTLAATLLLASCGKGVKENIKPIFLDGVYDGYEYSEYYENPNKPGDPGYTLPEYCFLFAVRNEENETVFASRNEAYINVSYGFFKTNSKSEDITGYITDYEIDFFLINNVADLLDYDVDGRIRYMLDGLLPALTLSDFYSDGQFNNKYKCEIMQGVNGKYIGFSHSTRINLPQNLFYFPTENITIVARVRKTYIQPSYYSDEYGSNFKSVKISYEKEEDGLRLKNFSPLPDAKAYPVSAQKIDGSATRDSLNYNGGNLIVSAVMNETAAKFGDDYYAVYLTPFDKNIESGFDESQPWSFRSLVGSRTYVLKRDGVLYYKLNLYQTFWRIAEAGNNGLYDPEEMFVKATSYKLENVKRYFEQRGESFGEPAICNYSGMDGTLNLSVITNASRSVTIIYYADGWIKNIYASGYGAEYNTYINYYVNLDWNYTQIDANRILVKPV